MSRKLNVYLSGQYVGDFAQDRSGQLSFSYCEQWLAREDAVPLSCSLLLRQEPFKQKECRGFFSGILPEEETRKRIAHNLGVSARNDFALLEKIGGECVGAVTFMPEGKPLSEEEPQYRYLDDKELIHILDKLPVNPLLAGEKGVRLSLAGVQDKLAVRIWEDKIAIPLENAPSTHILKPAHLYFDGLVFNEHYCMELARRLDLSVAESTIHSVGEEEFLLVKRYDRIIDGTGNVTRLHQEDFCQALNIPSEMKYQNEGGPSLKDCFELIRDVSDMPVFDLTMLLDGVIFNFLIGNHDAHGKNFSLLYSPTPTLAPFYDLISTVFYPEISMKMAMKVGSRYHSGEVQLRDFEKFAEQAGLSKPMVSNRIVALAERMLKVLPELSTKHASIDKLPELIEQRCKRIMLSK